MNASAVLFIGSAQYFFHFPALRQLIHQCVEVPDFLRQRVEYIFNPVTADDTGNQMGIGMYHSFAKKNFEGRFCCNMLLKVSFIITG